MSNLSETMSATIEAAKDGKEFFDEYRPDNNEAAIGDGSQTIAWKIKPKKLHLEYEKEFRDSDVTFTTTIDGECKNMFSPAGSDVCYEVEASFKMSF